MSQYYYTVSTLPLLSLETERFLDVHDFIALCAGELSPADFALLLEASIEPDPEGSPEAEGSSGDYASETGGPDASGRQTLRLWVSWERALRNELVKLRAQRLAVDGGRYLAEASFVPGVFEVAREAVGAETPLEGEAVLDRARWGKLDELETGHYFDVVKILLYSLRLQILGRRAQRTTERGRTSFDALYGAIRDESQPEDFVEIMQESEE